MCCGYEDLNDHDALRDDLLMQTAIGRVDPLASSPTLSRLETRASRAQAVALHGVLIEQFIASHRTAPAELVLDIDASAGRPRLKGNFMVRVRMLAVAAAATLVPALALAQASAPTRADVKAETRAAA